MKTKDEKIIEFLSDLDTEIDVPYMVNIGNIDFDNAYDSIYNMIEYSNGFDIEIIYYSRAIEYLSENDASLRESLAIAGEMGYDTENLNSEILASILASQNVREEFSELENEINEFFEELAEEDEEEE